MPAKPSPPAKLLIVKRLPSFEDCRETMRRAGKEFKGGWQEDLLRQICDNQHIIIRGPRQNSGKTFCTAVYLATAIVLGNSVIYGMPTQMQGQHIVSDLIGELVYYAEEIGLLRRTLDNVQMKKWDNGARFIIKSTDESAKGGVQGYTVEILAIDEAHEASEVTYEKLEPAITVAETEGREKTILIGIGGDGSEHLIAKKRTVTLEDGTTPMYFYKHILPDEIINTAKPEHREGYRKFYERKKATYSPRGYAQNILCEDWAEGKYRIFPEMRDTAAESEQGYTMHFHGIDVGKDQDATVIATFKAQVRPSGIGDRTVRAEWVHTEILPGLNYVAQAREIIAYIRDVRWQPNPMMRPNGNFAIEINGPGNVLRDIIVEMGYNDVKRSWANEKFKDKMVNRFNQGFRHGWFGVTHETTATHLSRLNFELKEKSGGGTKTDYDHSDILSAGLVAMWVMPGPGVAGALSLVAA